MKKVIEYSSKISKSTVLIDYNDINLEIAKDEAVDGRYSIIEVEEKEEIF